MVTRVKESETLVKHILRVCKCRFDDEKEKPNQKWNKDRCNCGCKNQLKELICRVIIYGILVYVLLKVINI